MENQGVVQTSNGSPKGGLEALVVKAGNKIIQINFRSEFAEEITATAAAGKKLKCDVEPPIKLSLGHAA